MTDPLLLTVARVSTFNGQRVLSNATGFFFRPDERLFLVTSRYVVSYEVTTHMPNRLEIELHDDADNMASSTGLSMLLYRDGKSVWREGYDGAGPVDVAVIEIDLGVLPETAVYGAFTLEHLLQGGDEVEAGASLRVVGFTLGFHDSSHHLPVVRQAVLASAFGLRCQGQGYFLTDARLHRGTGGHAHSQSRRCTPQSAMDAPGHSQLATQYWVA